MAGAVSTRVWRHINLALACVFAALIPIALVVEALGESVKFVVFLSLWALVGTHIAAWRADVPIED